MTPSQKTEAANPVENLADVSEPMLRISDLCSIFRCHRVTIWSRVRRGQLPPPVMTGSNSPRWHPQTIREHQASLPIADYAPDAP